MAETYEQIIEEIEGLKESAKSFRPIFEYADRNGIPTTSDTEKLSSYEVEAMKHLAARVRDAVAGDPSEWWVEDADGNRVHIGDDVKNCYDCTFYVFGLGVRNGKQTVEYDDGYDYADTVRKVIPDTREKIIEDAYGRIKRTYHAKPFHEGEYIEIISDAVDRAMKLGAEVDNA